MSDYGATGSIHYLNEVKALIIIEDDEITLNMAHSCERHPRPIQVSMLTEFLKK